MSTRTSKRLSGIKGDGFEVSIEYGADNRMVIVHLPKVEKMDKGVFIEMSVLLDEWSEFFEALGVESIYAGAYNTDTKTRRLAEMLGFIYLQDNDGFSIYEYRRG